MKYCHDFQEYKEARGNNTKYKAKRVLKMEGERCRRVERDIRARSHRVRTGLEVSQSVGFHVRNELIKKLPVEIFGIRLTARGRVMTD
jgi:hypothetical protein